MGKGQIEKITFNISQMRDDCELKEAFHQVQDACLKGSIPLVFFDEFDSDKNAIPLGWIKEFLAPMQDGEFTDNGVHPIGKCIFVFAGGVFENFDEFAEEQANKSAKVRDFISRLRGYINIQGPNPVSEQDKNFVLRRAVLLRSLIERKIGGIIGAGGQANMDRDIVRAMLRLPKFRHGVRSMEAIIDMSMLAGKRRWNKSDLPDKKPVGDSCGRRKL